MQGLKKYLLLAGFLGFSWSSLAADDGAFTITISGPEAEASVANAPAQRETRRTRRVQAPPVTQQQNASAQNQSNQNENKDESKSTQERLRTLSNYQIQNYSGSANISNAPRVNTQDLNNKSDAQIDKKIVSASDPNVGNRTYDVQNKDTIWSIATKFVPNDRSVSEFQVIASIYRNNPNAFGNKNINNLKKGTLIIPPVKEIARESAEYGRRILQDGVYDLPRLTPLNLAAAPIPNYEATETRLREQEEIKTVEDPRLESKNGDALSALNVLQSHNTKDNPSQSVSNLIENDPKNATNEVNMEAFSMLLDNAKRDFDAKIKFYDDRMNSILQNMRSGSDNAAKEAYKNTENLARQYDEMISQMQENIISMRGHLSKLETENERMRDMLLANDEKLEELEMKLSDYQIDRGPKETFSRPVILILCGVGVLMMMLLLTFLYFRSKTRSRAQEITDEFGFDDKSTGVDSLISDTDLMDGIEPPPHMDDGMGNLGDDSHDSFDDLDKHDETINLFEDNEDISINDEPKDKSKDVVEKQDKKSLNKESNQDNSPKDDKKDLSEDEKLAAAWEASLNNEKNEDKKEDSQEKELSEDEKLAAAWEASLNNEKSEDKKEDSQEKELSEDEKDKKEDSQEKELSEDEKLAAAWEASLNNEKSEDKKEDSQEKELSEDEKLAAAWAKALDEQGSESSDNGENKGAEATSALDLANKLKKEQSPKFEASVLKEEQNSDAKTQEKAPEFLDDNDLPDSKEEISVSEDRAQTPSLAELDLSRKLNSAKDQDSQNLGLNYINKDGHDNKTQKTLAQLFDEETSLVNLPIEEHEEKGIKFDDLQGTDYPGDENDKEDLTDEQEDEIIHMGDEISSTVSEEEKHNILDEVDSFADNEISGADAAKELINKFNGSSNNESKELEGIKDKNEAEIAQTLENSRSENKEESENVNSVLSDDEESLKAQFGNAIKTDAKAYKNTEKQNNIDEEKLSKETSEKEVNDTIVSQAEDDFRSYLKNAASQAKSSRVDEILDDNVNLDEILSVDNDVATTKPDGASSDNKLSEPIEGKEPQVEDETHDENPTLASAPIEGEEPQVEDETHDENSTLASEPIEIEEPQVEDETHDENPTLASEPIEIEEPQVEEKTHDENSTLASEPIEIEEPQVEEKTHDENPTLASAPIEIEEPQVEEKTHDETPTLASAPIEIEEPQVEEKTHDENPTLASAPIEGEEPQAEDENLDENKGDIDLNVENKEVSTEKSIDFQKDHFNEKELSLDDEDALEALISSEHEKSKNKVSKENDEVDFIDQDKVIAGTNSNLENEAKEDSEVLTKKENSSNKTSKNDKQENDENSFLLNMLSGEDDSHLDIAPKEDVVSNGEGNTLSDDELTRMLQSDPSEYNSHSDSTVEQDVKELSQDEIDDKSRAELIDKIDEDDYDDLEPYSYDEEKGLSDNDKNRRYLVDELNLARLYLETGDYDEAKRMLEEISEQGDDELKEEVKKLTLEYDLK